jgi:hypothetical protein
LEVEGRERRWIWVKRRVIIHKMRLLANSG